MKRGHLVLAGIAAGIASVDAGAQNTPCPPSVPEQSYRSVPVRNSFLSIVGDPDTVNVVFPEPDDATVTVGVFPLMSAGGDPFAGFQFFGAPRTGFRVSTNGFVQFNLAASSASATNKHPGDAANQDDCVMPWHDDLILFNPTSRVDTNVGFYGPETLVVQWTDVANWYPVNGNVDAGVGSFTFQAVLYSSSHATLPNAIEFRYDRTTAPPVMNPCQGVSADPLNPTVYTYNGSTAATSATIGVESESDFSSTNVGVEPTDRGAANQVFPACDLRLLPASFNGGHAAHAVTMNLVPQEPYCSIVGIPGTVAVGPPCQAGYTCYEVGEAVTMDGVPIPLPWKVSLFGRAFTTANMSDNGFMNLGAGAGLYIANGTVIFPSTAEPEAAFAPFWDGLEGAAPGGGMFWRVDGLPGCRVMTFEWKNFGGSVPASPVGPGDCMADGNASFQVKLYEGGATSPHCAPGFPPVGLGDDLVEFHYDHASFVPSATGFTASIGMDNYKGTVGVSTSLTPNESGFPFLGPTPAKLVFDVCDCGTVRYFGDPSALNSSCLPEIRTNAVPPLIGNLFGLQIVGGSAGGVGLFAISFGAPLPPTPLNVPCGGLVLGPLTVWVNLTASTFIDCGPTLGALPPTPASPCEGCCNLEFAIPNDPFLLCQPVFAQGVVVGIGGGGVFVELTEGARVTIGQ
jgi:hypothetical protein